MAKYSTYDPATPVSGDKILFLDGSDTVTSGDASGTLKLADFDNFGGGGGGAFGSPIAGGNIDYGRTLLMLHAEGADASTTITDSGPQANTVTANGDAQIDTAQFKFGASSVLFDGTGDYLSVPSNAQWRLDGEFTIEMFVRFNSVAANRVIASRYGADGDASWLFLWDQSVSQLRFRYTTDGTFASATDAIAGSWSPSTGVWYHVAVTRDKDGNMRAFVDGTQVGTTAASVPAFFESGMQMRIGANNDGVGGVPGAFNGWMDEIRILDRCAYTANFTAPAAAFADGFVSGVVSPEDYGAVGDGETDDTTAVASAIATGYDVYFQGGRTYLISGHINPARGQTLFGGGTLLRADVGTPTASLDRITFIKIENDDVTVDGLGFIHTNVNRSFAVTVESRRNVIVRNCRFRHTQALFVFKNSDNVEFSNNYCELSIESAFVGTGGDRASNQADGPVTNIRVINNTFVEGQAEGIDLNHDTHRFVISGNTFIRCGTGTPSSSAESLDIGGETTCSHGVVSSNVFDGGGVVGGAVRLYYNADHISFVGNVYRNFKTTSSSGVVYVSSTAGSVDDIVFSGEQISGGAAGFDIRDGTNIRIDACDVEVSGIAVDLTGGFPHSVTNCNLHDSLQGIHSTTSNVQIENNRIFGNGEEGIHIDSGFYAQMVGNKVYNNSQDSTGTYYGILIDNGSDRGVLTGNQVFDAQGTQTQQGVSFGGACDRWIVVGNMLHDNAGTNLNGTGTLTNSQVANNVSA